MNIEGIAITVGELWLLFPIVGLPLSVIAWHLGHRDILWRFIIWLVIIPVFLVSAYAGRWFFFSMLLCCCTGAGFELAKISGRTLRFSLQCFLILLFSIPWLIWAQTSGPDSYPWQLGLIVAVASLVLFFRLNNFESPAHGPLFLSLSMGISLSYWVLLENLPGGFRFVAFAFSVVVLGDIMAFLAGKAFAGWRPFPGLSPNKTLSGFIGGILSSLATSSLLAFTVPELSPLRLLLAGLLLAVTGAAGDLTASKIKRLYGVKDFSRLLGPLGGILDRLDSLLCGGCCFYVYLKLVVL